MDYYSQAEKDYIDDNIKVKDIPDAKIRDFAKSGRFGFNYSDEDFVSKFQINNMLDLVNAEEIKTCNVKTVYEILKKQIEAGNGDLEIEIGAEGQICSLRNVQITSLYGKKVLFFNFDEYY